MAHIAANYDKRKNTRGCRSFNSPFSDPITPWRVLAAQCAADYGLTVDELLSGSKRRRVSIARHDLMARLRADGGRSYPLIARLLNLKNHTSIIWGVRAHERRTT